VVYLRSSLKIPEILWYSLKKFAGKFTGSVNVNKEIYVDIHRRLRDVGRRKLLPLLQMENQQFFPRLDNAPGNW